MSLSLKRLLAVGTAATLAFVGVTTAPQAQAAPSSHSSVSKASTWLVKNPATVDDGYGGRITSTLGLAVLDTKAGAKTVRAQVKALADQASTQATSTGTALNLAILVEVMRLNPKSFGGVDLIQKINDGIASDGTVGSFGSAYSQALAIIALKRAHQPVPAGVVTTLLGFQAASGIDAGAFGYEYNGFVADPDSTALAIQALDLLGAKTYKAPIAKAVAWAKSHQKSEGYWKAYSPVDSTSLMISALDQVDRSYGKARSWLKQQQLGNGGFPASLGGTDANLLATSNATFGLALKSMATAKYALKGYSTVSRPKISGTRAVGQTLTAKPGSWKPAPSFGYQWYRNGHKIAGATAAGYLLTSADAGKRIRVKVTASGAGLKTKAVVSKATTRVKA